MMDRRKFLMAVAAGAAALRAPRLWGAHAAPLDYQRANTDWLAQCRYGIGVHWTAQTVPRRGAPLPFAAAVDRFDVPKFIAALEHAGAEYLLFTATHALQMLPAPHPVIDRLLPGRTCRRDLLAELAAGLAARGRPLLVYYNHSCNGKDDPAWRQAVGYDGLDKNVLARNLMDIVGVLGERYGDRVKAWWFDSPYSLDARGPVKTVTTDLAGFQFPWEQFTAAAKRGYADRLVTYNAGLGQSYLYTTHQDYRAGEMLKLRGPPQARYLDNGLQWFGWTCLDDRGWVHRKLNSEIPQPMYRDEDVLAFVRTCVARQAPMTFNVGIYQDSTMAPASVELLHRVGVALGPREKS